MTCLARRARRLGLGAAAVSLLVATPACSSTTDDAAESTVTTASSQPATDAASPEASTTTADGDFVPLNPGTGFGLLRVMSLEERPNPRDVVIYEALPNEMPRVAGVITTIDQTPLSHVNLRAVQDKVPNAYVQGALEDPAVTALIGSYVSYTVTASGYTIEPATLAEVEAHHAAARPTEAQTPASDLSVTEVTPLAEIGFDDADAFGVKAANVATMGTFDLPAGTVPEGYAVPFSFYDTFMSENGFYDEVQALLEDAQFRDDPAVQEDLLEQLRDDIKAAPIPDELADDLTAMQESFPAGTSLRCRSSTNNEDLPEFSGAGLYDSFTQHPDEGDISKCIKQVYASLWNYRAFAEREFNRVDHVATMMGVLIHPNFDGELANGVAVTTDPVYLTENTYYVNVQVGEDLVTNPEALSIPEILVLNPDGTANLMQQSNRVDRTEQVLTEAQVAELHAALTVIHEGFAELYDIAPGEQFAIEVEFKITADGELSIKQARPWIFN